jgi:regulatory protein
VRWRSEAELRRRLRAAGFDIAEVEDALEGLSRAGLVDDARFAREVVRDQAGRRRASARAIRGALRQKGVDPGLIEEAVAEAGEDLDRASDLARSRIHRLSGFPPDAAFRRLYGLLVRRGYSSDVAREACREALAEREEEPESLE